MAANARVVRSDRVFDIHVRMPERLGLPQPGAAL